MPMRLAPLTLVCVLTAARALAQQAHPSILSVDSVAESDVTVSQGGGSIADGNHLTNIYFDSLVTADFGRGFQAMVRPQIQRLTSSEWNKQIWIADLRWERPGAVAFRIEGGYIPSPIGLANLNYRPQLNPTIALPAELFTSLPSLEPRGPRVNLMGGIYPLGTQATVSAKHWDARAAVIDTSPMRIRRVFGGPYPPFFSGNPPRFANVIVGGGITPFVGFRVGAAVARGGWMKAGESPTTTSTRDATLVSIESELAFRHTSLASEWTRDALETSLGTRVASGWYVQGAQTLTPRWFVAARIEKINTMLPVIDGAEQDFKASEQTVGFRLTPELTLRVSHRLREPFGGSSYLHTGAVSIVWYRRWM
jgi:hypothetical protein